jgi:hypothetical protein
MITQNLPGHPHIEVIGNFRASAGLIIRNFIERIQSEQAEARRQMIKERQMLNEYHQEMIDGMPLQERLKMGNYRF